MSIWGESKYRVSLKKHLKILEIFVQMYGTCLGVINNIGQARLQYYILVYRVNPYPANVEHMVSS